MGSRPAVGQPQSFGRKPTDRNLVHLEEIADVRQLYVLPADETYTVRLYGKTLLPTKPCTRFTSAERTRNRSPFTRTARTPKAKPR
ncbi:MAG: hypothetical protein ACLUSP_08530 [Christensenellales bacterium]